MTNPEPPSKSEVLVVLSKYRKKITEKDFTLLLQYAAFSPDEFLRGKEKLKVLDTIRGYAILVKDFMFGEGKQGILTVFVVAVTALSIVFPNYRDSIIATLNTFPDYMSHFVGYVDAVRNNWIVFAPELPKEGPEKNTLPIGNLLAQNTIIVPISGAHPLATGELEYIGYKLV